MIRRNSVAKLICVNFKLHFRLYSAELAFKEFPEKLKKSERKPLVTSIIELKRQARLNKRQRQEACEIILHPPENGLLVKELVPVAHEVYAARAELVTCVSSFIKSVVIYTCSVCGEVHVGHPPHKIRTCNVAGSPANREHIWKRGCVEHILPLVESFHLYDRIGRAVSHDERLLVDRLPAIVELCVQAGVDIPEYPTRRRVFPVYNVAGTIIDFERRFPKYESLGKDIHTTGFWNRRMTSDDSKLVDFQGSDAQGFAVRGMKAWEKLQSGISRLLRKYPVQTCGYCPEVQVGPKGHRLRNCQAYKHQMRDGQHAWQEATVDDVLPPVYVWHVQDSQGSEPLVTGLKWYYGKLPAVVEIFAQAGAVVGQNYTAMMRGDIAVPELGEEKLVV